MGSIRHDHPPNTGRLLLAPLLLILSRKRDCLEQMVLWSVVMIFLLLAILMEDGLESALKLTGTGIYQPLRKGDVAVSPRGDVFILHFDEAKVLHYDAQGRQLEAIGRKGRGPGEFEYPSALYFEDGKLYVYDMGSTSASLFDEDGAYIDKTRFPDRGLDVAKAAGGWLFGNWRFSTNPGAPVALKWTDASLGETRIVAEWPRPSGTGGVMVRSSSSSGPPKIPYNPVREETSMVISPDGKWAYIRHPGSFKISVVDVTAKKIVHAITREETAVPFNEDWGQAQFEKFKERNQRMTMRLEFVPKFPDYFPIVRGLHMSAEGYPVVELWTSRPDRETRAVALTRKGQEVKLPYRPENARRIMAVQGGDAYISLFDKTDEEAALIRCPVNAIDQVIEAHPITFEGSTERLMVRSH